MDKIKLYYFKYFRFISGYFLIIFSAITTYMCIDLYLRVPSISNYLIIFVLFSAIFYAIGNRLIKTQYMINELYNAENILYFLRYSIKMEHYTVSQMISLLLLADMYQTIKTKKEIFSHLKWKIRDGHIESHKILESHILNFKDKMNSNYNLINLKKDYDLSCKLLEDTNTLKDFVNILNEDKMNFPMLIDLNKNHSFTMNDYYGKTK